MSNDRCSHEEIEIHNGSYECNRCAMTLVGIESRIQGLLYRFEMLGSEDLCMYQLASQLICVRDEGHVGAHSYGWKSVMRPSPYEGEVGRGEGEVERGSESWTPTGGARCDHSQGLIMGTRFGERTRTRCYQCFEPVRTLQDGPVDNGVVGIGWSSHDQAVECRHEAWWKAAGNALLDLCKSCGKTRQEIAQFISLPSAVPEGQKGPVIQGSPVPPETITTGVTFSGEGLTEKELDSMIRKNRERLSGVDPAREGGDRSAEVRGRIVEGENGEGALQIDEIVETGRHEVDNGGQKGTSEECRHDHFGWWRHPMSPDWDRCKGCKKLRSVIALQGDPNPVSGGPNPLSCAQERLYPFSAGVVPEKGRSARHGAEKGHSEAIRSEGSGMFAVDSENEPERLNCQTRLDLHRKRLRKLDERAEEAGRDRKELWVAIKELHKDLASLEDDRRKLWDRLKLQADAIGRQAKEIRGLKGLSQ